MCSLPRERLLRQGGEEGVCADRREQHVCGHSSVRAHCRELPVLAGQTEMCTSSREQLLSRHGAVSAGSIERLLRQDSRPPGPLLTLPTEQRLCGHGLLQANLRQQLLPRRQVRARRCEEQQLRGNSGVCADQREQHVPAEVCAAAREWVLSRNSAVRAEEVEQLLRRGCDRDVRASSEQQLLCGNTGVREETREPVLRREVRAERGKQLLQRNEGVRAAEEQRHVRRSEERVRAERGEQPLRGKAGVRAAREQRVLQTTTWRGRGERGGSMCGREKTGVDAEHVVLGDSGAGSEHDRRRDEVDRVPHREHPDRPHATQALLLLPLCTRRTRRHEETHCSQRSATTHRQTLRPSGGAGHRKTVCPTRTTRRTCTHDCPRRGSCTISR